MLLMLPLVAEEGDEDMLKVEEVETRISFVGD